MDEKIVEVIRGGLYKNGCDIEFLQRETENIMASINKSADALVNEKIEELLPVLKEKAHTDAVRQVRAEYRIAKGVKIYGLSPFISETIMVNGEELGQGHFILDKPFYDPLSEDIRMFFDDITERWLVRVKNGTPKLISRFVVVACLIIDASGPGSCRAFVVFLKGEDKPLVFWNGIIEPAELRKQTQFHQKGLSYARKDLYHESFMRALSMCSQVYFLTLPKKAGWNWTPDGLRVFVNSAMMQPEFEDLFMKDKDKRKKGNSNKMHNIFRDISLGTSEREFEEVVTDYGKVLPDSLPVKVGTVISAMSRLLPQFQEAGFVQDRLWVFESADDAAAKSMATITVNRHYSSTETLFSSMRLSYIEDEIKKYVDCAAIIRHSCAICSIHDFKKILKFLFELLQNGYADDGINRLVPILHIDNAAVIPEEFQIHQLSLPERLSIDNLEQVQRIVRELDFHIVKNAERNPDEVQQSLKTAIIAAKEMVSTLPKRSQSNSAVMFLSTALLLKEGGVFTENDVQAMLQWLRNEVKERTSMGRSVFKTVGTALSQVICSERKSITYYNSPFPWTPDSYYVAEDDSINVTKDDLEEIISELYVGKNTALKYLKAEEVLIANKGEEQKTWEIENEDGIKKKRRFYTFSRDLLTPEANRIVDEAIASDTFFMPEEHIENLYPMVRHKRFDRVAGQKIKNYSNINPFVCITGSPSFGKTDLLHMQALVRADAGDTVIIFDATNSSCHEELKAHMIPDDIIDERFLFWDMSCYGWPFELMDFSGCDTDEQKIQRLSSWLLSGSHMTGSSQISIIMNLASDIVHGYEKSRYTIKELIDSLLKDTGKEGEVKKRLLSLFSAVANHFSTPPGWEDVVEFRTEAPGWKKILSLRGKIIVISVGNAVTKTDCNALDIVLDSFYSFKDRHRDSNVTLVFDEIQRMNLEEGAALDVILSTGRKLNISAFLATQRYSNNEKENLGRIEGYCGTYYFFSPKDGCAHVISTKTHLSVDRLNQLEQGEFAYMGPLLSKHHGKNKPLKSAIIGRTYRPCYVGAYDDDEQP